MALNATAIPRRRRLGEAMPRTLAPMLAMTGQVPQNESEFSFEYKWDGVRALCFVDSDGTRILSRSERDITSRYPELHGLGEAITGHSVVLDGEIVALDSSGRPSFGRLQRRMHVDDAHLLPRLLKSHPIWYVLFDIVYLDGRNLLDEPYHRRRELLESVTLVGPHWGVTPAHVGDGEAMLEAARQNRLEGLIAKELDSIYQPGKRSPAWRKIKIVQRQEFVIGGWTEQDGDASRVGSLLIGYYNCDGKLHFAGGIGTGFTDTEHSKLIRLLNRLETAQSSFSERVSRSARFVSPELVAEVEYRRWPDGGLVQQGAYKGLRTDKPAREVTKETL